MKLKTEGLIIREQIVGESDRLITILTRDHGVLRAFARKAKKMTDSKNAATQLLCYSRLAIYQGRDKYIVNEAFPIEVFFGLREDIIRLSLAQYFCELACDVAPEGVNSEECLRIILNTLHFLSRGIYSPQTLKSIVEVRLMSSAGYMPDLVCCMDCGAYEPDCMHFLVIQGLICCDNCFQKRRNTEGVLMPTAYPLHKAALKAMRHIVFSEMNRLFSFKLSKLAEQELGRAAEAYVLGIVRKKPKTLDFYESIIGMN